MHSNTSNFDSKINDSLNDEQTSTAESHHEITSHKISVTQDELKFINKKRWLIKLSNPKEQFIFREASIGLFSHLIHIISFGVSAFLFVSLLYLSYTPVSITGVGEFSDVLPLEKITHLLLISVIIYYLIKLKQNLKAYPIKRYWFAMASNSFLRAIILSIKYLIILLLLILSFAVIKNIEPTLIFEQFENSKAYELFSIIDSFISLVIVCYSFRFCKKDLK